MSTGRGPEAEPLDYQTPRSPPRRARLTVGNRVLLGIGLSVLHFAATVAASLMGGQWVAGVALFPLGWLTDLMNARLHDLYRVPMIRAAFANSIFWGFLVAMSVYRRGAGRRAGPGETP
ncbi:MAG: hypothetical protein JWO31_2402 [Phycisphaerales bacterium]|nr:hypothetical protein [Phycisphaerales bacterium]